MENTLDIEAFDPTSAQLLELVAIPVEITDPLNVEQVKAAHEKRMKLREARVTITKTGKSMRESALSFQKAVIAKEKELVAILEPEEARLQAFEDESAALKEQEARRALLPMRRQKLADFDFVEVTDEQILEMDGTAFQDFMNRMLHEKNVREAEALAVQKREQEERQAELDRKEADVQAEKERQEREAKAEEDAKAREEKARQDERERLQREADAKKVAEAEKAKKTAEKAEMDRQKAMKNELYREWRTGLGWTEETRDSFKEEVANGSDGSKTVTLYKILGTFSA